RGRSALLVGLAIAIVVSALAFFTTYRVWGYDHIQAFLTASRLENRSGFLLLHRPLVYVMTRIEDIAEIVLFLSLGTAATMLGGRMLPFRSWAEARDPVSGLGGRGGPSAPAGGSR